MNLLLDRLKPYGFNERVLTEDDFYEICEREGIEVVLSDRKFSFHFSAFGESCIVISKQLKGLKLLFAAFHELGHALSHIGHEPSVVWLDQADSKNEAEADAVALIALMPIGNDWQNIFDGTRYSRRLYEDRCRLNFLYGI